MNTTTTSIDLSRRAQALHDDALKQLYDEVDAIYQPLGELLGYWDEITRAVFHGSLAEKVDALVSFDRPTCRALLVALWPRQDAPSPEWWRTPVGRLIAMAIGDEINEPITHAYAAAMLGVAKGTVATLLKRGKLDYHPVHYESVNKASVLYRIATIEPIWY